MKLYPIALLLIALFQAITCGNVLVTASGTNTIIEFDGGTRNACIAGYANNYPSNISQVPAAQWIWDGTGLDAACNMNIRVHHTFTLKCPGLPISLYVGCDNIYQVSLGSTTGTGNDWSHPDQYTVDTTGIACTSPGTTNCLNNPAALIFGVVSQDCTQCPTYQFYDPATCTCAYCTLYMAGCLACTSSSTCTSCNSTANFVLSNSQCVCNTGYALSGSICKTCVTFMSNCNTCSSSSVCTSCASGYAVNNSVCATCASLMTGCTLCSSKTICTACTSGYTLVSGSCPACSSLMTGCATCSSSSVCSTCSAGYVLNGSTCQTCQSLMTGCTACSSKTVCTTCNTAANFVLSGSTCACASGYTLVSGTCTSCSSLMTGCSTCSSSSVCSTCSVGYALNLTTCSTCSSFIPGCVTCSNKSTCTTCNTTDSFLLLANATCGCVSGRYFNGSACPSCDANCLTCVTTSTNCLSCVTGKFLQSSTCKVCAPGCLSCTSLTNCSSCDTTAFTLINGICSCLNGTFLDTNTGSCVACHETCLTCSGASNGSCTSCDYGLFRLLSGTTCVCNSTNYQESLISFPACQIIDIHWCPSRYYWDYTFGQCMEVCGDGKLYDYECDDGNTKNGDGCSSTCKIESKYACINGSQTSASVCSYNQSLVFSIVSSEKDPFSNNITYVLSYSPNLPDLAGLNDLPSLITTSIPNQGFTVSLQNGLIKIVVKYNQTIQETTQSITLNAPDSNSKLFALKQSTVTFVVKPTNNNAAVFYNQSIYNDVKAVEPLAKASQGLGLGSMGAGMIFAKSLSLQLVSVLQCSYLGESTVKDTNPIKSTIKVLKYMNGYNNMFKDLGINLTITTSAKSRLLQQTDMLQVNTRLQSLGYKIHFIENFNYMYAALILLILLSLLVRAIGSCSGNPAVKAFGNFMLKELVMVLLFFNINNMGFSMGIQFRYLLLDQIWDTILIVSWALAGLSFVIVLIYLIYYCKGTHSKEFGDFNAKFKEDKLSQIHYAIILTCRYLANFAAGYFNEYPQICYGVVGMEFLILVYIIWKRPYMSAFDNALGIVNEAVLVFVAAGNMFYRIFSDPKSTDGYFAYPAWIQLILLGGCVVLNYIGLMYYLYLKCKAKSPNQVHPSSKKIDDEEGQKDEERRHRHHKHKSADRSSRDQKEKIELLEPSSKRRLDESNLDMAASFHDSATGGQVSMNATKDQLMAVMDIEEEATPGGDFAQAIESIELGLPADRKIKKLRFLKK